MELLPNDYQKWCESIEQKIAMAKLESALKVNADLLALYHSIGKEIIQKQDREGWGKQVIAMLSRDLQKKFPDDRGFSERNIGYMKQFALAYPDFPILQVPLAKIGELPIAQGTLAEFQDSQFLQVPLAKITWYHHISLISKVKSDIERAFYIQETARNGWSRDVMLLQIDNGYIKSKGKSINNFASTLPDFNSDLARDTFKDPYKFSFLATESLRSELEIEKKLTEKITDFLVEMGRGFAFVGRQFHIAVDGDDYYVDLLMYHLKLHCYVAIELKAVEFKPEFVSKLNFYVSAIDEYIKTDRDEPTIGLLLCRSKNDTKARLSLKGFTQPMGIASYQTQKIFEEVINEFPDMDNDITTSI